MRYLVTGGAGFIGSNTVEELVRRGHRVAILDDLSTGKRENLAPWAEKIEFLQGSVNDLAKVRAACEGTDFVLHLAARTSVPRSLEDPVETNRVNVEGTLNVLVGARDARVRRVVLACSSSSYGETPVLPKVETMTPAPVSPYGVSKFAGEVYAQVFHRVYGLETVCLRYFNVFGPRQDPDSPYSGVLSRFCMALLDGAQPVIFGDGEQTRDFTYVSDVVEATLLACDAPGISGMVFNIGTSFRYTLNQTLELLQKVSGKAAKTRYAASRRGDIRHSQANIELARKRLGYNPRVSFEEGLRRTWTWYRKSQQEAKAFAR